MAYPVTFLLALAALAAIARLPAGAGGAVPAIYLFGDSTVDVGNNNYIPGAIYSIDKANYPPNGIDFPSHIPTGRFCNGYIGIDFTAMRMGFEKSPQPVLSGLACQENRGENYASGGSGILDQTGLNVSLSMNTQIGLFEEKVSRMNTVYGTKFTLQVLSKSIFTISTGNNDLFDFFRNDPIAASTNQTLQDQFISSLTSNFQCQLKRLYSIGARKMVVSGIGQLGCTPALRVLSPTASCLDSLNGLSQKFNAAMKSKMISLAADVGHLKYSYINSYDIAGEILNKALQFGFKNTTSACCGGGLLNAQALCTPNATYCSNRDEYLSWDFVHPTQAYYKRFNDLSFDGALGFVEPISLNDLIGY